MDIPKLKKWFHEEQRDLPWRNNPTPYAVWISEIMLQQTQVAVVIPYFLRWMERFPTIDHLAKAQLEEVIKLWEGLGYYSRVRNLHQGAQVLVREYGGELPDSSEELFKIKGLGDYTVGAILSFAFHQKVPAIDGNVQRVITRYYGIEEDILKTATKRQILKKVEALLPDKEPWIVSEALIELGATHCTKKAKCSTCPLVQGCIAHRKNLVDCLPMKSKKSAIQKLHRLVLVITTPEAILLRRGAKGEIMSDLYEFPYFATSPKTVTEDCNRLLSSFHLPVAHPMQQERHSFTRYQAHLYPFHVAISAPFLLPNHHWIPLEHIDALPFSSGHRKIKQRFMEEGLKLDIFHYHN